ncbi:MAG TPA: hypothetical protein VEY91_02595 [Candidatus Limnocylindria bacterium]|nr:hypothetical protein [Candidatus Limnocylindria bacterium]
MSWRCLQWLSPMLGACIVTWAPAATAYTGGPVRAELVGYEPNEHKLYYTLQSQSESDDRGRYFYLHLDSAVTYKPIEARSLGTAWVSGTSTRADNQNLINLRKRLERLVSLDSYDVGLKVEVAKRDSSVHLQVPRMLLDVDLRSGATECRFQLEAFCRSHVAIVELYLVPGRTERVALTRYTGVEYYCELADAPIVLREGANQQRFRIPKYAAQP